MTRARKSFRVRLAERLENDRKTWNKIVGALDSALEAETGCADCGRQLPDHRAQLAGIETFLNQALGKPVQPVRDETPNVLAVLRPARSDEHGPEDVAAGRYWEDPRTGELLPGTKELPASANGA